MPGAESAHARFPAVSGGGSSSRLRTILRANCAFGSHELRSHEPGSQSNWTRATQPSMPCPRGFRSLALAWGKRRSCGRRKSSQVHGGSPCSGAEDKNGGSSMRANNELGWGSLRCPRLDCAMARVEANVGDRWRLVPILVPIAKPPTHSTERTRPPGTSHLGLQTPTTNMPEAAVLASLRAFHRPPPK